MTTVISVVTGAFVTYFFTRGAVEEAKSAAQDAKVEARAATGAFNLASGNMERDKFHEMVKENPEVRKFLSPQE